MASGLFDSWKSNIMQGLLTDDVRAMLVNVVPNKVTADFLSDISATRLNGAGQGADEALGGKTAGATAVFDSNDITFDDGTLTTAGETIAAIVLYIWTGSASTSRLVASIESWTGPTSTDGNNIDVSWNGSGIFQL